VTAYNVPYKYFYLLSYLFTSYYVCHHFRPNDAAAAAQAALDAAGFTPGGIKKGSLGAKMMSQYGGKVPAGSFVSTLQAAGAGGIDHGVEYWCQHSDC